MINLFRLATTEAGLERGFLYGMGIFAPSNAYQAYTAKIGTSLGSESRQGYKRDSWQWLNVTPTQASEVTAVVNDALANNGGVIYATLPQSNGDVAGQGWIDVSAYVSYPDIQQVQGVLAGLMIQSMTLQLNNITVINDPSTVVQ